MWKRKQAVVPVFVLGLVLGLAGCSGEEQEVELTAEQEKAASERLQPAGEVTLEDDVVATAPAAESGSGPRDPETIYNRSCQACHVTGAAGAPKLDDTAAWETRLEKGMETLYTNAIQGFKGMPPRGTCMDCTDEEIEATVDWMVEQSQ